MPTFTHDQLRLFGASVFEAAGVSPAESRVVTDALVDANLAGHDSHGVMRMDSYLRWIKAGDFVPGAPFTVVAEGDAFAVIDGGWGFGQVQGRRAMELAIEKARKSGTSTVSGRNCTHLGRLGDYPRMAAEQGLAAVMYINTHGAGRLLSPFAGIERRLSANPIAIGIPRKNERPIILDISTCQIAEGKIRNMNVESKPVPEGCIIDSDGNPTTDASKFYGPPQGALLPIAGHKGFGLALAFDILAGAISGAGCSRPDAKRIGNSFLMHVLDVDRLRGIEDFSLDVESLIEYVKSSQLAPGFDEILVPGEPELRTEQERRANGIPVPDGTVKALSVLAAEYGVSGLS